MPYLKQNEEELCASDFGPIFILKEQKIGVL